MTIAVIAALYVYYFLINKCFTLCKLFALLSQCFAEIKIFLIRLDLKFSLFTNFILIFQFYTCLYIYKKNTGNVSKCNAQSILHFSLFVYCCLFILSLSNFYIQICQKKKKQTKTNKQKRIYVQSFNFLYKVENISYILQVTLNLIY